MQKRSLWERLTGSVNAEEGEYEETKKGSNGSHKGNGKDKKGENKENNWIEEENEEAELAVDLYQTPTEIIVQTMKNIE